MEDSMPLFTEISEFQYREETLKIASFGISGVQYSNARNKNDNEAIKNMFTTKRLSTETLTELKPVVMGDRGGYV